MSDKWQPIETAPSDKRVKVGRYSYSLYGDEKRWVVDTAIPFKTVKGIFGNKRVGSHDSEWYTHWMPLPPPPSDGG